MSDMVSFEPLLNQKQVAQLSGLSESSLEKFRMSGDGPRFVRIGRAVRYRPADVRKWLDGLRAVRTTHEIATA
jgi:predicted DNA-binding transcriptional regulator AlpA